MSAEDRGRHSRWEPGEEVERYRAEFAAGMDQLDRLEADTRTALTALEGLR